MSKRIGMLLISIVCVALVPAWGQSALERLEDRVRQRLGQNPDAVPADDDGGPGYLGVIADDRQEAGAGVRIVKVLAGGPADQAGLKVGDLVVAIDGRRLRSMDDVAEILEGRLPDDKLRFDIRRDDERSSLDVVLGRRPARAQRLFDRLGQIEDPALISADASPDAGTSDSLGVVVDVVTPEMHVWLRLPEARGALVIAVAEDSPAEKAGLRVESVIVAVDGKAVETPRDLVRLVDRAGPGGQVKLAYYRHGKLFERKVVLVPPDEEFNLPPPAPAQPRDVDADRMTQLERRIAELEVRLAELERGLDENGPKLPKGP